jgi:hypothetical protein
LARVHGKDLSTLTLNSQALLTDTKALNYKASSQTHDVTTLGDDYLEFIAGLKGGDDITHELMYDNTNTTGTWAFITNLLGAAATTLAFGDGTRSVSVSVIVIDVSLPIKVSDMMMVTATYKQTGTITFS